MHMDRRSRKSKGKQSKKPEKPGLSPKQSTEANKDSAAKKIESKAPVPHTLPSTPPSAPARIPTLPDLPLGLSFVEFVNRHLVGRGIFLSAKQEEACQKLEAFLRNPTKRCFVLKGYAGTGKTFLIDWLNRYAMYINLGAPALAAPTGRAAFVLSQITGAMASTIHGLIYQLRTLIILPSDVNLKGTPRWRFPIKKTVQDDTSQVFIIDEASMVSNALASNEFYTFGTEHLLQDLIEYTRLKVRDAKSKIIFVGDDCQLPPYNTDESHALDKEYLQKTFGLEVDEFEIDTVLRQREGSGILSTATFLRHVIKSKKPDYFDIDYSKGDIDNVKRRKHTPSSPPDVADLIASAFQNNESNGIAVTWKNEEVFYLNIDVRERLWGSGKTDIRKGDRLVIGLNAPGYKVSNGELVMVRSVSPLLKMPPIVTKTGKLLKFRTITFEKFYGPDEDRIVKKCLILENALWDPTRDIEPEDKEALYWDFSRRYYAKHPEKNERENPKPAEFRKALSRDRFYNALRVKFGYAMTCHKAQGGQWDTVSVVFDLGRNDAYTVKHLRWAYTAITRAQRHLNVVDAPRITPLSILNGKKAPVAAAPVPGALTTPLPFQTHLETVVRKELGHEGIKINTHRPVQGGEKYFFERDGKDAVIIFWYDGDGYFTKLEDKDKEAKVWDRTLVSDIERIIRANAK